MRVDHLFIILLITLLVLPVGAENEDDEVVDRIAAVVGSEIILLSEVLERAIPLFEEMERSSKGPTELMLDQRRDKVIKEVVQHMIDDELIAGVALEMQLSVTAAEIDSAMENMAAQNGVDIKTLAQAIKAQGMNVLTYRGQLRKQILRYKVLNLRIRGRIKITEAEARQFYNDQVRDVRANGKFEGAHILVRLGEGAGAADTKEANGRAQQIKDRISEGEEFAEVARTESEDKVTAPRGGSLGELDPGVIPSTLDRAFLDLEVDEIAGPIRTAAGFHVIKLISRENTVQPFSEVKDRILSHLGQQEMARQEKVWLNELRLRTFIDVRL
jgi:peptidyl-prolyl cis-trans isomerase SurA